MILAAEPLKPAGGAALGQVLLATALGGALTAALVLAVWAHRTGRTRLLTRTAVPLSRATGQPPWVALPSVLTTLSLLVALLGMYWDISTHIGQGRDVGPLANAAHYPILFGLFGIFAAGVLATALPVGERPGPAAVRLTRTWYAPVGGLLLTGAAGYALLGFPLDDVWHRIFGQDVTLWGPTHLMLIGGAGLSLVAVLVLEREGAAAAVSVPGRGKAALIRRSSAMGGLLIGLSVFQGEYDFGVPQFRLVLQPVLVAAAAGVALVAARAWIGRGGAVAAALLFLGVRGAVSLAVGIGLHQVMPSLPLYLGSALLVELTAVLLHPRRALLFGAVAGLVVGTLGMLTEAAWSQVAMPLPWTSDLAVEGLLSAGLAGTAAGLVGALLALGLRGQLPAPRVARPLYAGCLLVLAGVLANGLVATVPRDAAVQLRLTDAGERGGVRMVQVTAVLPARTTVSPAWVTATAWQGGGLVVEPLVRTGDTWRTTRPVPVGGDWKTLVRVHDGRALSAVPVYLPEDPVIGAHEVAALPAVTRPLQPEIALLQRERQLDVPGWLWGVASLIVLGCSVVLAAALGWGVGRVARRVPTGPAAPTAPATRPVQERPAAARPPVRV